MEIDASKDVYLFVHGRSDLVEKSTAALVAKGFAQEKIIQALPQKTGNVGDYMAMLWMPPNPTTDNCRGFMIFTESFVALDDPWTTSAAVDFSTRSLLPYKKVDVF